MQLAERNMKKKPDFKEFIAKQDWTGALVVLGHEKTGAEEAKKDDYGLWLAYAAYHLGDYKRALDEYTELVERTGDENLHLFRASCLYYLQMYDEAKKAAQSGPTNPLQNRILFHLSHRQNDETSLMLHHQKLSTSLQDQLSLAAIHYLRGHFQEATDIYKRLLLEDRDNVALNVYVAMCYYKLDYYDVSLEILAVYLQVRRPAGAHGSCEAGILLHLRVLCVAAHAFTQTHTGQPHQHHCCEPQGLQPLPPVQRQGCRGRAQVIDRQGEWAGGKKRDNQAGHGHDCCD